MGKDRLKQQKHKKLLQLFILLISVMAISIVINPSLSKKANTTISDPQMDDVYKEVAVSTLSFGDTSAQFPSFGIKEVDTYIEAYIHSRLTSIHSSGEEKTITYNILHYSQQTLSVAFTESGEAAEIMTFDLEKGVILAFEDLILQDHVSDCLELLAEIASAELTENDHSSLSAKDISKVTAPKAENYRQFIIYNQAIVFNLTLNTKNETYQLAISKQLLDDWLIDDYRPGEHHDDLSGNYEPANIITERPTKESKLPMDEKVVALTFDDGPKAGVTDLILDALKKYDAKATFFVLGSRCDANKNLLKRAAEEGHEIGNHTWDHPKMTSESSNAIADQIDRTNAIIEEITGTVPTIFRPPYGLYDERISSYVGKEHLILWDVDTLDWKLRNADLVVPSALNTVQEGNVILMHDIYSSSAKAAAEIIHELSRKGYKFVTVSELLEIKKQRLKESNA